MVLAWLIYSSLASAQNLSQMDCYYIKDGQLRLATNMGCIEKRRSGDSVIYQVDARRPSSDYGEKPGIESKTMTLRLNRKDGRIVSLSKFEGEDPARATVVHTIFFKNKTGQEHGEDVRRQVTLREGGRETDLVTYDRDFCTKLHGSGNLAELGGVVQACAATLVSIKKAANQFNLSLKADHAELGVPSGETFRAANIDGVLDLFELVRRCKMYFTTELPRKIPAPGTPAPERKLLPAELDDGVAF